MDLHKIISELQTERQRLDEAILALEKLSSASVTGNGKKRGRPPLAKQAAPKELAKAADPRA